MIRRSSPRSCRNMSALLLFWFLRKCTLDATMRVRCLIQGTVRLLVGFRFLGSLAKLHQHLLAYVPISAHGVFVTDTCRRLGTRQRLGGGWTRSCIILLPLRLHFLLLFLLSPLIVSSSPFQIPFLRSLPLSVFLFFLPLTSGGLQRPKLLRRIGT
jgi:hypothetical protein